jgi:hypothetical protein
MRLMRLNVLVVLAVFLSSIQSSAQVLSQNQQHNIVVNETKNIKYNEIDISLSTIIEEKLGEHTYTYTLENRGQGPVLISLSAVNEFYRLAHTLIELSANEKREIKSTSNVSPDRFSTRVEIFVPDSNPRFLFDKKGVFNSATGKFWVLTYVDVITLHLPSDS